MRHTMAHSFPLHMNLPQILSFGSTHQFYPLVNVYITMENHHVSWENSLFLWPCSSSQTVSHYQRVSWDLLGFHGWNFFSSCTTGEITRGFHMENHNRISSMDHWPPTTSGRGMARFQALGDGDHQKPCGRFPMNMGVAFWETSILYHIVLIILV